MMRSRAGRAAFLVAAVFEFFLLGTMPLGNWAPAGVMIPVSAIGALIMLALFASVVVAKPSMMVDRTGVSVPDETSDAEDLREAV